MNYHTSLDLDHILNASEKEAGSMLQTVDGQTLSSSAAKSHAAIMKAQGYVALAIGCDDYCPRGFCKGHPPPH